MKTIASILVAIGLLLASSGCGSGQNGVSARPRIGEKHVVALPDTPKFLTEDAALSGARVALTLDRLDSTAWHAVRDDRTIAPDGRRDEFLARNTTNPNRGVIAFTNGASTRFVAVELQSNLISFQCSLSK